ncbi:MAG: hypothetical protein RBT63_11360 [Bdellovibrionales bacterium]|jgi:hypothetical protein|nr:hypothetical protein [Bdellovibrionales bacterium]
MNYSCRLLISILLVSVPVLAVQTAHAQGAEGNSLGGLQLFAAADLVAEFGMQNPPVDTGRLRVRGFEIAAFAPVDPLFDALVNIAGHDENGVIEMELHEAVISSTRLLPQTRFKVGRFLLGVGRLNQSHSHDWPFTSPPKMQKVFFSEEAAIDTGGEIGRVLNLFGEDGVPVDIVVGMTNGWTYGHSHTGGRRPMMATHYVHPSFFFDLGANRGFLLGLNYLGRTDADSILTQLAGVDFTYKRREGRKLATLVQGEVFYRRQSSSSLPDSEEIGGYVFSNFAVGDAGWSAGLRLDGFTTPSSRFLNGERRENFDFAAVPVVSYKASEFSTFRVSYTFGAETRQGDDTRHEQKIELQLISIMGAHPAHDF